MPKIIVRNKEVKRDYEAIRKEYFNKYTLSIITVLIVGTILLTTSFNMHPVVVSQSEIPGSSGSALFPPASGGSAASIYFLLPPAENITIRLSVSPGTSFTYTFYGVTIHLVNGTNQRSFTFIQSGNATNSVSLHLNTPHLQYPPSYGILVTPHANGSYIVKETPYVTTVQNAPSNIYLEYPALGLVVGSILAGAAWITIKFRS